ncbi:MAG: restriction endonuclease [Smithellaceae bacterium]|jgi:hypothetical protein
MNRDEELEKMKEVLFADISSTHKVLTLLTPREEKVMRLRLGIWDPGREDQSKVRRLLSVLLAPRISLIQPLASIKQVSPDLMLHLKHEHEDITKVPARVFEEIVAELLAGMGWKEVKLVGRRYETSADILAGHFLPDGATPIKIFIEAKRWKDRIGVEVFNQVLGAMVSEREKFGWHQAWIMALGGAADTRKFSRDEWRAKGLEVKDKRDLFSWLDGYQPNSEGLWLPPDILEK